jgi:hypothetical protein
LVKNYSIGLKKDRIINPPNFLIIGAMKAGTTSFYNYLNQHPEVFMSEKKEPHFFAYSGKLPNCNGPLDMEILRKMVVCEKEKYYQLFSNSSKRHKAIGEASTMYLYYSNAASNIYNELSDVKILVFLRNPVERAFSSYVHLVRDGREKLSFEEALKEEENRIENNWVPLWHYKNAGLYYGQLKKFYDLFDHNKIKIILFEEFRDNPKEVYKDVCRFLEIKESFEPNFKIRYNVSGLPRNQTFHNFLKKRNFVKSFVKKILPEKLQKVLKYHAHDINLASKPNLDKSVYDKLKKQYVTDISNLEKLIDRNLTQWVD